MARLKARKGLPILVALVLVLSFSLVATPAAVSAAGPAYTFEGSTIAVTSLETPFTEQTEDAFNAEPHTTVVDDVAFDAQARSQVTIEGEVSSLDLGAGWLDTAYVEIGLRPEATKDARNAGVYLIAYNAPGDPADTVIHLQDYTGMGFLDGIINIPKDSDFRYKITLEPSDSIGGTATLEVWVGGESQGTVSGFVYGYASDWRERRSPVAGADYPALDLNEDFSEAHLFYSIIAECRGEGSITYSATVGDVTIDDTLYVGAGQQFNTIQDAIDFANPGDTINVAAGTYNATSSPLVRITKSLTLVGESRDSVVLDGMGTSTIDWARGIHVTANDVTIMNLTVQNFGIAPDKCGYGILFRDYDHDTPTEGYIYYTGCVVENVRSQNNCYPMYALVNRNLTIRDCLIQNNLSDGMFIARECDNATITGNTVINSGDHGIWVGKCWMGLGPSDNATITDNVVDGAREGGITFCASDTATITGNDVSHVKGEEPPGGYSVGALSLKDGCSNVNVSNNVIHDNDGRGTGSGRGIGIDGTSSNIAITGNTIRDNAGGGIKVIGTVTDWSCNFNNIYGNTGYGVENTMGTSLDFADNWWGSASGPTHASNTYTVPAGDAQGDAVSDNVDFVPWLDAAYDTGSSFAPVTNTNTGEQFSSIQAAIDDAHTVAGNTINVADGTYTITSAIDVNKGVTITGDVAHPENVVVTYSAPSQTLDCFDMQANDIAVQGIKVVNGRYGFNFAASDPTGCTISNCVIDHCYKGAINIDGGSGHTISDNTIKSCLTSGTKRGAIHIYGCPNTTIDGNTLIDNGLTGYHATMGIYVKFTYPLSSSERVEVINNNISGMLGINADIQIYNAPYTYIYNNTISNSEDKGIAVFGIYGNPAYTSTDNRVQVIGNTISSTYYPGLQACNAPYTYFYNNTLTHCNYYGGDGTGDFDYASIHIDSGSANCLIDSNRVNDGINGIQLWSDSCTVTNNTIYDMGKTYGDTKVTGDGAYYNSAILYGDMYNVNMPTSATIIFNNIYDNYWGLFVIDAYTGTITAEDNWWGHASGPKQATTNPSGLGNAVSDNVHYSPWCAADDTDAETPGYQPPEPMTWGVSTNGTIQEAIDDFAFAGDTINVAAGIYTEHIVITTSNLTLVGEDKETTIIDATQDSSWAVAKAGILIGEYPLVGGVHDVTVSGFTIKDAAMQEGGVSYDGKKYGVGPGGLAGIQIYNSSNNTIENNILSNNYWQIWIVAEWPAAGYTECKNNRIANNIIQNSENDGVYLYSDGGVYVENTEIVNNEISNAYGEVASGVEFWGWPEGGDTPTISGTVISGNNITNCTYGVRIRSDVSDITGTSVNDNEFENNSLQVLDGTETLDIQLVLDTNTFDRAVVIDRPSASLLYTIWSSIQEAIDAANPDDTINVAAGTYNEQVVIDEQLTLNGANADVNAVTGTRGSESIIYGETSTAITISADNVIVDGFTLDGGITLDDLANPISGGTISNNIITGADNPDLPIKAENGIRVGFDHNGKGVDGITIENNTIINSLCKGIRFSNTKLDFNDPHDPQRISHITISGNEIKYNGSAGIETYGPGHNTIINNIISSNGGNGINLKFDDGDVVTGNTITDNHGPGITLRDVTNTVVENNSMSGHQSEDVFNEFVESGGGEGSKGSGIHIVFASENNTIRCNDIGGNNYGIFIHRGKATDKGQPSGNSINFNNIAGNDYYGILNALVDPPASVNAENNWWGANDGPSGGEIDPLTGTVANGSGDKVSANVHFDPWIGAGVAASKTEGTESGDDTVDATDEADTVVEKSGTGTPTVTVVKYEDNPGSGFGGDTGKYIDVHIDDTTGVDELVIKVYYTDAEVAGLDESSLKLRWWDGDSWEACSDSGVNTAENYMWAKVRADTTPSLSQLTGTPFAGRGTSAPVEVADVGPELIYLRVDFLGEISKMRLGDNNRLRDTLIALSPDGRLSLEIEEGTLALVDGKRIYLIEIREAEECPPLPENTMIAGAVYDITPSGVTFDKDVILILGFTPMELPENTVSVTMAYYVSDEGWVELESEQGGVAELGTMTTAVSHFTPFAILAKLAPPAPPPVPAPPPTLPAAHFVASGLTIEPSVREIWEPITFVTRAGESVTITANVANDGGQEGTYIVELKINGETVDAKEVTLGAGQSQRVSFTLSGMDYGRYEVEVAGLSGEFTASRTINWWLIIGIIAAIGLITWGVIRGRRRVYS